MLQSMILPKFIFLIFLLLLFILPHLNLVIYADLLEKIGVEDSKTIEGNVGEAHEQQLPICRVCSCNQRLRTVQCVPRRQGGGDDQFRLRMIRLPHWAETFIGLNLSQPEFPHFASHPGLRQLRLLHSQLFFIHPLSFAPLPGLELIQLADNALEQFPMGELLQPLGHLRTLELSGNRLRDLWLYSWNGALMGNVRLLDRLVLDRNPLCPHVNSEWPQTKQLHLAKTGMLEMNSTHFTFYQPNSPNQNQCSLRINPKQWNTLEEIHLDENPRLKIFPDAIKPLAQLRLLKLSQATIPEQFFLDFPNRDKAKWQHLNLNGVRVQNAPTLDYMPFEHLPVQVGRGLRGRQAQWTFCTPELEWLDITGMGLQGELSLGGCKQLKWFYGGGNGLDGFHLGDGLGPNGLLSVSLRSNRLRHFPSALLAASQSLVSLQLANNSIRHLPDEGRLLLGQFPRLQYLDLAENKLRHFELEPFSSQEHPPQLLALNLSHNQIHQFHITFPLESLTILDLTANELKSIELAKLLRFFPSLEHLHLAQNRAIHFVEGDTVMDANSALVQLDLANCSLTVLPDLSRLYALRELNAQGNRLHQLPTQLMPKEGLMLLDLRGNFIQRLGWDWSKAQLSSLHQLRLQANPLDCSCPMPQQLAARLERLTDANIVRPIFEDHSGYVCIEDPSTGWGNHGIGHWQHPLDAFLFPADPHGLHPNPGRLLTAQKQHQDHLLGDCPSPVITNLFHAGGGPLSNAAQISMEQQDPSLFALFLLPVLLITGSLAVGLLLLRGSPKWQELHWAHTEAGSMLAYEQLHAEQMADTV